MTVKYVIRSLHLLYKKKCCCVSFRDFTDCTTRKSQWDGILGEFQRPEFRGTQQLFSVKYLFGEANIA